MTSVTLAAHDLVRKVVRPGEVVVDATAGNGHDTLFLASLVGAQGQVLAIDIQSEAIASTERLLKSRGISNVILVAGDHADIARLVSQNVQGRPGAVMFNLGYLPGGDKQITTHTATTLKALNAAADFLRAGGILTVVGYPGHPGGLDETMAVSKWFTQQDSPQFELFCGSTDVNGQSGPQLFAIRRVT